MTRVYYNGAVGAGLCQFRVNVESVLVVVFDATRPKTLEGARQWKQGIDGHIFLTCLMRHYFTPEKVSMPGRPGVKIPVLLLANKCDLGLDDMLEPLNLHRVIEEEGFLAWFATSAKDNIGITESFTFLVEVSNQCQSAFAPTRPFSPFQEHPNDSRRALSSSVVLASFTTALAESSIISRCVGPTFERDR